MSEQRCGTILVGHFISKIFFLFVYMNNSKLLLAIKHNEQKENIKKSFSLVLSTIT